MLKERPLLRGSERVMTSDDTARTGSDAVPGWNVLIAPGARPAFFGGGPGVGVGEGGG